MNEQNNATEPIKANKLITIPEQFKFDDITIERTIVTFASELEKYEALRPLDRNNTGEVAKLTLVEYVDHIKSKATDYSVDYDTDSPQYRQIMKDHEITMAFKLKDTELPKVLKGYLANLVISEQPKIRAKGEEWITLNQDKWVVDVKDTGGRESMTPDEKEARAAKKAFNAMSPEMQKVFLEMAKAMQKK